MKLSILNKKNNHKPNLQYANQGVILLLLVVRANDQWRKGGCSSFLKFWPLFCSQKNNKSSFSFSSQKSYLSVWLSQKNPPLQKIYSLLLFIWQPHPHGIFYFLLGDVFPTLKEIPLSKLLVALCIFELT